MQWLRGTKIRRDHGRQTTQTTDHGRRTTDTDHGRRTTDHGRQTTDDRRRTTDHKPRITNDKRVVQLAMHERNYHSPQPRSLRLGSKGRSTGTRDHKQRTTNDKRQTINNKLETSNKKPSILPGLCFIVSAPHKRSGGGIISADYFDFSLDFTFSPPTLPLAFTAFPFSSKCTFILSEPFSRSTSYTVRFLSFSLSTSLMV